MGIVNHECDCIRFLNRAYATMNDKAAHKYNLGETIGGCQYNLSHSPGDPWNAIAHLQIGLARQLQGQPGQAITSFNQALQLNPKLAQAYTEMANVYLKLNNKKQALTVVTEGLRWLPDSRALQRKYQRLGGALPFPAAHNKEAASADKTPKRATGKTPDGTGTGAQPATAPLPKSETATDPTQPTAGSDSGAQPTSDLIGSPTNPWCRFCPDTPAAPPASSPSMPGVVPKDWK
ncbi:MAG: tetratricopeptide repeat protein [Pseudomonadota bacterium]|nr:tetratricopeptide repeat protein [Pseudomonadota bacterium]MDP1904982.1 tetratricopeptide repeat protein [Pseudomonadota bacterium]MDP2351115.1 tetratricopeptide repeat protein [Pseudomonadota bacterium]